MPELAGLPERVFVIRDQDLAESRRGAGENRHDAAAARAGDAEGDILNTGPDGANRRRTSPSISCRCRYPEYRRP